MAQHRKLGTRPLGAALVADARIERYPLRQRKIGWHHELYRRLASAVQNAPRVVGPPLPVPPA